jgi:hypothetical protein
LLWYGSRHYDPELGRFIKPDTIIPDPSNSQGWDRYSYALNNPIRYNDPTGHCTEGADDYEECLDWVKKIEEKFTNINVITCIGSDIATGCVGWTAKEVELAYETFTEYILNDSIDDHPIWVIRTESDEYAGLHSPLRNEDGSIFRSDIRLSDKAWTTSPSLGIQDTFDWGRDDNFFKGTLAHELTHAAVFFHPEIMDHYRDVMPTLGVWGWLATNVYSGLNYDWSYYDQYKDDPVTYALLVDGEHIAMAVAATMYDDWFGRFPGK